MEHVYILQCFLAPMFWNKCGKSIEIKYKEDIKLVNSYYFSEIINTRSKNYLYRDIDWNLDCNLDEIQKMYPITWDIDCSKRITFLFIVQ